MNEPYLQSCDTGNVNSSQVQSTSSFHTFLLTLQLVVSTKHSDHGHNDTTRAVNFHPTLTV